MKDAIGVVGNAALGKLTLFYRSAWMRNIPMPTANVADRSCVIAPLSALLKDSSESCWNITPATCPCGWRLCKLLWRPLPPMPMNTPKKLSPIYKRPDCALKLTCAMKKFNYKVREHSAPRTPAIMAVGRREAEQNSVSVRRLGDNKNIAKPLDVAVAELKNEAQPPL